LPLLKFQTSYKSVLTVQATYVNIGLMMTLSQNMQPRYISNNSCVRL